MATYKETAKKIVKEAIRTAIYIDENAREPFEEKSDALEGKLSENLYDVFQQQNIKLSIFKYGTDKYKQRKDYLFSKIDFVLLDWKLNKNEGEDEALKILDDIICGHPNIHFCAIYTKENDEKLNEVFGNIISYFSGYNATELMDLRQDLEDEDTNNSIDGLLGTYIHPISRYRFEKIACDLCQQLKDNYLNTYQLIRRVAHGSTEIDSFVKTSIAFSNTFKSEDKKPTPSYLSFNDKTVVINNTIILLLNKKEVTPSKLINRFTNTICKNEFSFLQLLGAEMQTIMSNKTTFIPDSILYGTRDIFIYHKKNAQDGSIFNDFVKSIMLDHVRLCIEQEPLKIVDALPQKVNHKLTTKDFISVNSYYDSLVVSNKTVLSFGDVFASNGQYYLCITALCDCLHPNKDHCFYFVKGSKIDGDLAIKLGEGGFISYINGNIVINWATISNKPTKQDQYKPTYIKPQPIIVPNTEINNGVLRVKLYREKTGNLIDNDFQYLTTIKNGYAQRIANHAFAHPVRVGIDFVKK